ncbi:MAG: class I SAM-dependent methyltransferase [Candidatus Anammoximicrobium sp.]|nr:class I SAM-dependent methyltransferase [Candidatus Anammoximicrobium sp.]
MTITQKYFGQTALEYDAKRRQSRSWLTETGAVEDFFRTAAQSGPIRSVLDIPCGTGRWIPFFQDQDIDYTGVDVSQDMIAVARRSVREDDARNVRILEQDCFQYLPARQDEFDLVVSTRFLGWWHTETALSLIESLCAASKKFVIIHLRVHNNGFQVGFRRLVKWPKFVGRYGAAVFRSWKEGRLSFRQNVLDVESHPRKLVEDHIQALGWTILERVVTKRLVYANVEIWLLQKDEATC